MPRVTVIAIGSPFADDRMGWDVAEILCTSSLIAAYGEQVAVAVCRSPASELIGLLANTDIAIVVDAVRFCGAPGTVYRLADIHSSLSDVTFLSSHGMDIQAMLALADALESSPGMMIVYGIESRSDLEAESILSAELHRAVVRVAEDIQRDVASYCAMDKFQGLDLKGPLMH
jgi:hydrogenase maturation protease